MRILFDSKNLRYKKPFGCVKTGERVYIAIDIPVSVKAHFVSLRLCDDDENVISTLLAKNGENEDYETYSGIFSIEKAGLYFYYFRIESESSAFSLYKQGYSDTNMEEGERWQLTCVEADYAVAEKFHGCVMYQIFPDRFNIGEKCSLEGKLEPYFIHENKNDTPDFLPDSTGEIRNNDFFGGNLDGIRRKLEYISSLGVTAIYLNPVFKAYSNHRYDTCDYMQIDPMLGTEEDFVRLCHDAQKQNISIILDGVFSHTGDRSVYFTDAVSNPASPYRSWYSFKKYPYEYDCWWGIKTLPNVNELNHGYMDYIINSYDSVIAHWLRLGASGFRLDVADELPDEFIKALRRRVKQIKPDGIVIGEVWEDASNKSAYGVRRKYFTANELDSVMNYPYKNAIISFLRSELNADSLAKTAMTIAENYPKQALDSLMNILSTHDTVRALTALGEVDLSGSRQAKAELYLSGKEYAAAAEKLKKAAFLQYVLPGSPCIYYGDEIGMQGFDDPLNRRFFSWESIDNSLLEYYRTLGKMKNNYSDLKSGDVYAYAENDDTIIIKRGRLTAVLNRLSDEIYGGEAIFKDKGCILKYD